MAFLRLFAVIFLILPLSNVMAWTKLQEIEGDAYYVHVSTVDYRTRTAWLRVDLRRAISLDGVKVGSTRELMQIDCNSNSARSLESTAFSRRELKGNIVKTRLKPSDWRGIPPNTPLFEVRRMVCR
jgi:hypothetical protein